MKPFAKTWLPLTSQLQKLCDRGLIIQDPTTAELLLSHANYYRLTGYTLAFMKPNPPILKGVRFEDVAAAYDFDGVLRDLLTEALEVIEVDLRTRAASQFGQKHGPFGHVDQAHFYKKFDHASWLKRIRDDAEDSTEMFVDHCYNKYSEYPDLPIWMLLEVISFGSLVRFIRGMKRDDQTDIADSYGIDDWQVFGSAIHHLSYVRNLCAHHSRVWDRLYSISPRLPDGPEWRPPVVPDNSRLFMTLCLVQQFLNHCRIRTNQPKTWRSCVIELLGNPPQTSQATFRMGLPGDWLLHPLWK